MDDAQSERSSGHCISRYIGGITVANEEFHVDTARVAKQVKKAGEFMLMKCDSGNLLFTGQFVLSLSIEQFWSVRCKLEVPELGKWYIHTNKDGLFKQERDSELEKWEQMYNNWLNYADPDKHLTKTLLELMGCNLYTDGTTYIAVKQERIGMMAYSEDLQMSGNMVVIDGVHIIAPMSDSIWQNNSWLRILPGMYIEKEAEDEK